MIRLLPSLRWLLIAASFALLGLWWWAHARGVSTGSLISFGVLCNVGSTLCGLYMPEGKRCPLKTRRFILIASGVAIVFALLSLGISTLVGLGVLK